MNNKISKKSAQMPEKWLNEQARQEQHLRKHFPYIIAAKEAAKNGRESSVKKWDFS